MAILEAPNLDLCWSSMTIERYAAFEQAVDVKVVKAGDIWWRQVRPFLYRPLLPFKTFDTKKTLDSFNRLGAFQHAVPNGQPHNSYLNPIVFDQPRDYNVKKTHQVHVGVKKALKHNLTVSRIVDESEFTERAYPCYLSFYERTQYAYGTSRREKAGFARWSHTIFQFPELVVLGAFQGPELLSFIIFCQVDETVILKTLVNSNNGLKLAAPDLLIHSIRLNVSRQPTIRMIFNSMYGLSSSINKYYLCRGARVLALPANLHLHRTLHRVVRQASKSTYDRLLGLCDDQLAELHASAISD
jgi:hypothetical protein